MLKFLWALTLIGFGAHSQAHETKVLEKRRSYRNIRESHVGRCSSHSGDRKREGSKPLCSQRSLGCI